MDIAQKGIESLLETTHKIYKSSTIVAFQPRLATNNGY